MAAEGVASHNRHREEVRAKARVPIVRARSFDDSGHSKGGYLVDPASSHMLVSKIKPCMSKYKLLYTVKLRMAH